MEGSAAAKGLFKPHDEVISIDGKAITRFEDIRREIMVGLDSERVFKIKRDGAEIELKAVPVVEEIEDHFGFKHSRGMLGIISPGNAIQIDKIKSVNGKKYDGLDDLRSALIAQMGKETKIGLDNGKDGEDILLVRPLLDRNKSLSEPESDDFNSLFINAQEAEITVRYNIAGAMGEAISETWNISVSTLEALGQVITGSRSASELGGIIRIGAIAGDMAKAGVIALVTFAALLSINLGLVNLFPIPMLDGGHLLFYGIEAVKGSPIPEQIQEYAFRFGLAILVGIMLFTNLNDIVQIVN
jgi:regulator of sigma E protease